MTRPVTAEEFVAELDRLGTSFGEENTEALQECDKIIVASVAVNFQDATTARGEPWPARKPNPREKNPGHSLLILEGDLQQAATTGDGEITDGKTLTRRMPEGSQGTSLAGIRRHEFGDEEMLGKEGILARPYYGVSPEAADRCADKVADYLVEQVTKGF